MGNYKGKTASTKRHLLVSLFFLLVYFFVIPLGSQENKICFDHISIKEKLSQNTILCILKDRNGFMWFGTQHGLNRYDGRNIKVYLDSDVDIKLHEGTEGDKGKFGNQINDICEDREGNIWLATDKGLFSFNPTDETFHAYKRCLYDRWVQAFCKTCKDYLWVGSGKELAKINLNGEKCIQKSLELPSDIRTICEDNNKNLWVGTENGLFKIDKSKKYSDTSKPQIILEHSIFIVYRNQDNTIWVGTKGGFLFFKKEKDQFELRTQFDEDVRAISEDGKGKLWIGLNGDGIAILPKQRGTATYIRSKYYYPKSLNDNYVQVILRDDVGTFWVGTFGGGINKYNPKKEKIATYLPSSDSLTENQIVSIFEDKAGFVWVGSRTGKLYKFIPGSEKFKLANDEAFLNKAILSIFEDSKRELWIGTDNGGFFLCVDRINGKFESNEQTIFKETRVRIIKEDREDYLLWIGTQKKGIFQFDPENNKIENSISSSTTNGLSHNNIYCVFMDKEDNNILWIGTAMGLDRLEKPNKVTKIKYEDNIKRKVYSIVHDHTNKKILWLATGCGICKFNKYDDQISKIYTKKDGLPNDLVYGILKDRDGYLWLSTNNGISKFDPHPKKKNKKVVIRNFDENDGLQANEFNSGAYCKTKSADGTVTMYFGGIEGLSVFQPDKIEIDKETKPPIYFISLKIKGEEEIKPGVKSRDGREILTKSISKTNFLKLNYQDQPIRLDFAALDYNVPSRINFKYDLLKGSKISDSKKEEEQSKENFYILSNLDSGTYIFRVWGSNSDEQFLDNTKYAEIEILIKKKFSDYLNPLLLPIILVLSVSAILIATFYSIFRIRAKKRIERLEKIERAIDGVSRNENFEEVALKILDGIVYSFGFDYAAISIIDFLNSTISTIEGKSRIPEVVNPNDWKDLSNYSLINDNDILIEVVKKKKTIKIVGPKIDIDKDERLNKKIFNEYNHKDLIRLFVPIEYLKKEQETKTTDNVVKATEDVVLGVVEAGFHKSSMKSKILIWPKTKLSKELKILLELFISYCGVQLHKASKIKDRQKVYDLLEKSVEIEHHRNYLEKILEDAVILVGGDKGDISFISFNEKQISLNDNPIFYNIRGKDKELIKRRIRNGKKKGIVRHAAETNHYYFSGDVKNDDYYIKEFEEVNSELAVPIRYSERVIAVLNIYSTKEYFFDDRKANIIQDIANEAGKIFQKKKMNQTIKNLVLPFDLFTGTEKIYNSIINSIRNYFITEYVSIWERTEKRGVKYELKNAGNKLKGKYNESELRTLKEEIFETNSRDVQMINFEQNNSRWGFEEFARKYDFHAMILVPIIVDKQIYGFMNVFSKRKIPSLFSEDRAFLNLIASKGAISAQYEKLISSFLEVSNSLPSENLNRIISNIAENANRVLHADPVMFFKYDQDRSIFDAIIYGSLLHPLLKGIINNDKKREDHLALFIIRAGSVWFENATEYLQYIGSIDRQHKGEHFDQDFWTREKIKSSAGIRLEHNGKPIGVMFFNYRQEQRFDRDTRRFIEAFSSLAASAIVNANNLDLIAKQKQKLEEQKAQILTQKQKLEFEYEEIYRKMNELLPRAARTSFYLILEGINHDIRNFLIRMKEATLEIKDKSWKLSNKEKNIVNARIKDIDRNIINVSNLLELFDFKNSGREGIKINDLIKELTFFFKTRESEAIYFNIEKLANGIPIIVCNKAELSMIVYNLLSNSVFAIVSDKKSKGEIKIATDFKDDEYSIVVKDNGIGIDKRNKPRIFEAGFTTKKDGMGIGLYFVSETLRENFYGTIECESQYGHWTRFTIKIPEAVNYKED